MRHILDLQQLLPTGGAVLFQQRRQLILFGIFGVKLLQIVRRLEDQLIVGNPRVQIGDQEAIGFTKAQLEGEIIHNLQRRRAKL